MDNVSKFVSLTARENIFLLIVTVSVAVASLIVIFLFKDRKMQFKVTLAIFASAVINIIIYFLQMKNYTEGNISLTSLIHFAIPLLLLLAARSIWKDDQLVKSVDRLR
jgi:drug/metabolite transporter (DMT)-like permease